MARYASGKLVLVGHVKALGPLLSILVVTSCLGGGPGDSSDAGTSSSSQDGGVGDGASACSGSACPGACPTGFADCDNDPSNGCETNIATDAANCGACGAACGAANTKAPPTCDQGACAFSCKPGYLHCASASSLGCDTHEDASSCGACGHSCGASACTSSFVCAPVDIATGQNTPMGISVDTGSIYWAEYGADKIRRAGLDDAVCAGNACAVLADTTAAVEYFITGDVKAARHNPLATSSDGSKVYFTCKDTSGTGQTGALSVSVGGGEVDLSGGGSGASYSILAENGYVFYTNHTGTDGLSTWDGDKIHTPDVATTQSTGQTPGADALASDTGRLYFADNANGLIFVRTESDFPNETSNTSAQPCDMNQAGTSPICSKVISAPGVTLVAVANGVLFWSDTTSLHRYKFLDQSSAVVATNQSIVLLKADSSGVYWANSSDNSFRMAKATDATCDGAACKLVIDGTVGTTPSGLALDSANIYVSYSGSGLVAKRVK